MKQRICRPTALYRYFDQYGALLYIGISKTPIVRLSTHQSLKNWEYDIATVTIAYFDTRKLAIAAEWNAIAAENPLYNIQGKRNPNAECIGPRTKKVRTDEEKRKIERERKARQRANKKAMKAIVAAEAEMMPASQRI